MTSVKCLG